MVGDFFKHVDGMIQIASKANKIVKWLRNHSFAYGKLRECQESEYGTALALITPVFTRWTAHYCSAARLEAISTASIICAWRQAPAILDSAGPTSSENYKAALEVLSIIKDLEFWKGLHQ